MKNILLPTDFSKNSWEALEYAIHLFEKDECTFYIMNAFQAAYFTTESIMVPEPGEPAYDMAHESSEEGLEKWLKSIKLMDDNPNHHFKTISSYNSVSRAVRKSIEHQNIHLVVMGTKGAGDPENRIFGSNTIHVSGVIESCPLLIVPENAVFIPDVKKEVVLASNFKPRFNRAGINYLADIANRFSASIRVLHIQEHENLTEEQESNKEYLHELLKNVSHSFHTLTNISVHKGIISFIESRGSQLLILNNKKADFFKKIFSRSLLKAINKKPQIPILVLPAPQHFPRLF